MVSNELKGHEFKGQKTECQKNVSKISILAKNFNVAENFDF